MSSPSPAPPPRLPSLSACCASCLEDSVGVEEANKRIYATTDRAKGTLKQLATEQGWPTFVVPDDVGGRYSVLTAVGLLPIACAGIDIDALMQGAADGREKFGKLSMDNDAYRYAMTRNILYRKGTQRGNAGLL